MWVRQLPAIQMLCYFNSIMGYLSTIICFPVFLIVPVVSVYTKTHPVKELTTVLVILWSAPRPRCPRHEPHDTMP